LAGDSGIGKNIMRLLRPTKKYEKSWRKALKEFEKEKRRGFWNIPNKPTHIIEYIKRTNNYSKGKNLPDYWVQADTYWLIDKNKFVGHINVRHRLTNKLKRVGGHIGYAIAPSERNKGYGNKILELVLPKVKVLKLKKVLLTCDDSNIASWKIIEKNTGKLKNIIKVKEKKVRRYWIKL
jgi:predicted acetyltransferase